VRFARPMMVRTVLKPRLVSSTMLRSGMPDFRSFNTWAHCASLAASGRPTFCLLIVGMKRFHRFTRSLYSSIKALWSSQNGFPRPAAVSKDHIEGVRPRVHGVAVVLGMLGKASIQIAQFVDLLTQFLDAPVEVLDFVL
jgi:hypothetical protein